MDLSRSRGLSTRGNKTKIYGSYQQAYDSQLAQGNGAHLYWTPGNAIPYPGGGEPEVFYGKSMAGHFVHNFNSTTTNDFMAAWAFGSFPFVEPDPSAVSRDTLGYPYDKVFQTSSLNIPAYSSAGTCEFPGLLAGIDLRQPSGPVCSSQGSATIQRHADQGVGKAHCEGGRVYADH